MKTKQIIVTLLITLENEIDTEDERLIAVIEDVKTGVPNHNIRESELIEWDCHQPSCSYCGGSCRSDECVRRILGRHRWA